MKSFNSVISTSSFKLVDAWTTMMKRFYLSVASTTTKKLGSLTEKTTWVSQLDPSINTLLGAWPSTSMKVKLALSSRLVSSSSLAQLSFTRRQKTPGPTRTWPRGTSGSMVLPWPLLIIKFTYLVVKFIQTLAMVPSAWLEIEKDLYLTVLSVYVTQLMSSLC